MYFIYSQAGAPVCFCREILAAEHGKRNRSFIEHTELCHLNPQNFKNLQAVKIPPSAPCILPLPEQEASAQNFCDATAKSLLSAKSTACRLTDARSPAKCLNSVMTLSPAAKPNQTEPTGFSAVPPVGPAMPETDTATSAPAAFLAPAAISLTVSRLTAPCLSRVSAETPTNFCFAPLE